MRRLALAFLVVVAGCAGDGTEPAAPPTSTSTGTTPTEAPGQVPATPTVTSTPPNPEVTAPSPTPPAPTAPDTTAPHTTVPQTTVPPPEPLLAAGSAGADVLALEQQLMALRYWPGSVDGVFDELTRQAVFAFQKAQGLPVDGIVGPQVRRALLAPRPVVPVDAEPSHVEVDRTRQLFVVVHDGAVRWVLNTSTGTELPYDHPTDGPQLADTPPGRHVVEWEYDDVSEGELGPLHRPKFFHSADGIAVHGASSVPPVPASHGCVRLTIDAMDLVWAEGLMPIGSLVLVHGTTPMR